MNDTSGVLHEYDIAIVGAGAYGTAVLGQLALTNYPKTQPRFHILVVERSAELGPGLPYSKNMTIPDHIVNIAGGCTQINATYIPLSEKSDFLLWLRSLQPEYRTSLGVDEEDGENWLHQPFPRFIVGLYLSNRFTKFVDNLRKKGFMVEVRKLTTVTRVSIATSVEDCMDGYNLQLDEKGTVFTKRLFVATGHWASNRFPGMKCWLPSPFPPNDLLKKTELGNNAAILGCSLSAIDTALTLAKKNGSFYGADDNGKEALIFEPFKGAESFKMTMYARQAMLPQVMGVVVNKIFSFKHLTPTHFIPIIQANDGFLPLDDFWCLLKREIYEEVSDLRQHFPANWETISLEETILRMRRFLQASNPVERLQQELDEAKESLNTGVPLLLQNVFYQSYAIFDEALHYFSAEERIRFEAIKTELHILIGPFPVQNAEKLLALMKGGYLEVRKIGKNYSIKEDVRGVRVSWKLGNAPVIEACHDFMVDATGQKAAFEDDQSSLTLSMRENKLLRKIMVPFRDAREARKHRGHCSVVTKNGLPYFSPSGSLIDLNNFSLVSATKVPSPIYYMGPFTMGQVAFPQDMSVVTTAAERAVADLIQRRVLENDETNAMEEDPMPIYGWIPNAKGDLAGNMGRMTQVLTSKVIL